MAGGQKFKKALDFVNFIEGLILKGDRVGIYETIKACSERNHLVALGSRLKQLILVNKSGIIFTQLTLERCKEEIYKILEIILKFYKSFQPDKKTENLSMSLEPQKVAQPAQSPDLSTASSSVSAVSNSNMKIPIWNSNDSSFGDFVSHKLEAYFAIEAVSDNTKKVWSVLMALEAGSKYANHWRDLMAQFKKTGDG